MPAPARCAGSSSPATTTADRLLDDDFGASPNLYRLGHRLVVAEGRKDAGYHVRDAATGAPVFSAVVGTPGNLQQDFAIGGFLGTPAVWHDAGRPRAVIGATAIPVPHDRGEVERATWAVRAIDPADGLRRLVRGNRRRRPGLARAARVPGHQRRRPSRGEHRLQVEAEAAPATRRRRSKGAGRRVPRGQPSLLSSVRPTRPKQNAPPVPTTAHRPRTKAAKVAGGSDR